MTFSKDFIDICLNVFNIDVHKESENSLRKKIEDIYDEYQLMIQNLIGKSLREEHLLISMELNNKIYFSKLIYTEFMENFNK